MWPVCTLMFALEASAQPAPAPAPVPADPPSIVERVERKYDGVSALRMAFTQTVRSALYGDQTQTGTVLFARPGKMRWTFDEEKKHYVSDGTTLWVYLEQEKQAWRYAGWDPSGSPESLLHSLDHLSELFTVVTESSGPDGHVLKLLPISDGSVGTVILSLDAALDVRGVTLVDAMSDTKTELLFRQVEVGPTLPDDAFSFTPPPGVEVLEAAFPASKDTP